MEDERHTDELRRAQLERERLEREQAEAAMEEGEAAQHARRADKSAYLRRKLEERAESERES